MPYFQTQIVNAYPDSLVQVLAFNQDAPNRTILANHPLLQPLTYPLLYDSTAAGRGLTFQEYQTGALPTILLVNQAGVVMERFDGAATAEDFLPEMAIIEAAIDSLLANPPGGP
ncbi:MAG: hypothetical protein C4524_14745 [Candidatus Zixiibacteriota bacterium]|nr:MAG: hypothetical protein C4524_14745 [candidate division Zixibacteria bacterium]